MPRQTRMNPHFCEIPFLSLINAVAHHRRRTAKTGCASRPCLCRRMDNWGVGRDMWTSLQNARLDHMTLLPPQLPTRGLAFGLTRFACQSPFEQNEPGGRFRRQSLPPSAAHNRPLAHVDSQGGAKIEEKAFKRPVASWTYPGLKQTGNPPSWAPWLIRQGV